MASTQPSHGPPGRLLALLADLGDSETVEAAVARAIESAEAVFDGPVTAVCEYDPAEGAVTTAGASAPSSMDVDAAPDGVPGEVVDRLRERRDPSTTGTPGATVDTDPREPLRAEAFVPVGGDRVLCLGVTDPDELDEAGMAAVEGLAANLAAVLARIDGPRSEAERREGDDVAFEESDEATLVTERNDRQRQLESLQEAIEAAGDGIAVLDDGTYTYVDRTHVEMYGYDEKADLLGNTWRKLYDDDEIARLEREVFPVLESEGYWRGMVTGSRPDGSTFPAELSLTLVGDGRLVCTVRDDTERRARERELELKERAMDEATVGIQIADATREGTPLVYVNEGFEQMSGYNSEEAVGRDPRFLLGEEADPEQVAQFEEAMTAEEPVSLELRNRRRDGTPYWSRTAVTPVKDDAGVVENYICIQQDVTERRTREQRAAATVEVFERMYDVTTDPALSFEEKVDGLLSAGSEYLDLPYGFLAHIETNDGDGSGVQTVVEATGAHELLQAGETSPLSESYCRKTIESDDLVTITDAAEDGWQDDPAYETFELETYVGGVIEADDDTFGTLCFASSTPRERPFTDTERSFIGMLRRWVGYEIARENARTELEQQRERLEITLSGTNTGIAEWDLKTDAMTVNETIVELFGRDVGTFEQFEATVHPDDRDRVREGLEAAVDSGEPWAGEFRITDVEGATRWVGTRAVPTYEAGTPVRVLATVMDVTDRKRAEDERRRNERRYRSLAENIPNGAVLTFDDDLEYTLATGELLSAFGLERSDVTGQSVGTVLADVDAADELVTRFRAALAGERTDRRVDVHDRTLRVHVVPLDHEGEAVAEGGLVLIQDVTEETRRERDLLEERERFRLLTESVEEYAFVVADDDGVVQTWNGGAETMFGYDAETAVGMPVAEFHPESERDSGLPERLLEQARVAGESGHEGWYVRADGSEFYADARHAPLETDDGEFRGYAKIVRDMTDRRRQQRRTERFVEESDDVVTIVDTDGTITYASGSARRVLGYDPDDLVGENLFDHVHPDGRETAMETFFGSVDESKSDTQAECRIQSGDGEWLNVEGRCRNMLDDDAIEGMLLYLRDVTESKQRARRFESIFNQTFQFTGLLEPDGTVIEVNDAALEFGGIDRAEIAGESFSDAKWWTHSEAVRDDLQSALDRGADGEFVRYETEVRGGDGLATIDFSVKPVFDEDGDVNMLVAEGRDITARLQHRRHLEVMQRVLRHNMRNDLTKVRGWTAVMRDEDDAGRRAEQFETVERVLDKWTAMTQKMKEIRTALESQQERRATAAPESVVADAVAPVREEYPDATVVTEVSDAASTQVPSALVDGVRELVENAAKVSADATVAVELTRRDDWTEIRVRDDGPGMPEMEADVLETGEETPLNHGQGLGLWMVRMLVTQAGGTVSVDATENGTEVCLRLPTSRVGEPDGPVETTG